MRSIFALTATREPHKLRVTYAASGARALSKLEAESDIELVLMDVKMPDLDGATRSPGASTSRTASTVRARLTGRRNAR